MVVRHVIPAAMGVLPAKMDSPKARAMLLAIGLQESRFMHRRQTNFGPARGFWQFEKIGVRGVCKHRMSMGPLNDALRYMRYESLIGQTANLHYAIEDNDVLACVFARLLLYTVPNSLPDQLDNVGGWNQYIAGWNPGKPHPDTWQAFFVEAWARVGEDEHARQLAGATPATKRIALTGGPNEPETR
jgi:hypothetical protein